MHELSLRLYAADVAKACFQCHWPREHPLCVTVQKCSVMWHAVGASRPGLLPLLRNSAGGATKSSFGNGIQAVSCEVNNDGQNLALQHFEMRLQWWAPC